MKFCPVYVFVWKCHLLLLTLSTNLLPISAASKNSLFPFNAYFAEEIVIYNRIKRGFLVLLILSTSKNETECLSHQKGEGKGQGKIHSWPVWGISFGWNLWRQKMIWKGYSSERRLNILSGRFCSLFWRHANNHGTYLHWPSWVWAMCFFLKKCVS